VLAGFGVPPLLCFENGEAACGSFGFTFFGFFFSRLLRIWPLAMASSPSLRRAITPRIKLFVQQNRSGSSIPSLKPVMGVEWRLASSGELDQLPMSAGLQEIDRDIADVEGRISAKNETIMSGLRMGDDTILEEGEVGEMNRDLQGMRGARRKIVSGLRVLLRPKKKRAR
jgi:hypothetical protein